MHLIDLMKVKIFITPSRIFCLTKAFFLLGNLSLGQSCVDDLQCTGTKNGGNCRNGKCLCEKGFVLQRLKCLPGIKF